MSGDVWFHIVDSGVSLIIAIFVVPAAKKISEIMKYYPPHRHTNGNIEYPPGMNPGRVERLSGDQR